MYEVCVSSHTDIGDRKQSNQDSILCKTDIINGHNVCMFVVADGCGGLKYGEEVSKLITVHFSCFWDNELKYLLQAKRVDMNEVDLCLNDALNNVNRRAVRFSEQVSSRVGSTLTMLVSIDNKYIIKNIGDSRVYVKKKNKLIKLTEDQSLVADMVRSGRITEEEAKNSKRKNVLTMCVGAFNELKIYSRKGKIKNKDIFVLCSDGLHNYVSPEKMLDVLKSEKDIFEQKAQILRNSIESGKAADNVSSVVCGYYKRKRLHTSSIMILIGIIAILAIIFKDAVCGFFGNR